MGTNPAVSALSMSGAQHCVIEDVKIYGQSFRSGIKNLPGSGGGSDALLNQNAIYSSLASLIGHKLQDNEAPDSFNMLDVMLGNSTHGRELMLREAYRSFSLRKNNYKYIPAVKEIHDWIQTTKKIEGGESLEPQLYDLSKDIGEQNNIAKQHPELIAELDAELQKIIAKPTRRVR